MNSSKNSTSTNITIRDDMIKFLKENTKLSDIECRDLEIGFYNWTIDMAIKYKITKNWKNPKFIKIYLEKARSVYININSNSYINNSNLEKKINQKEIFPHEVAFMKAQDIYPEKWQDNVDNYNKKYEHAYEKAELAVTEMFRCGKCGLRKCTFYEQQTRSADEPMTIFITCVNCGNKWRQ